MSQQQWQSQQPMPQQRPQPQQQPMPQSRPVTQPSAQRAHHAAERVPGWKQKVASRRKYEPQAAMPPVDGDELIKRAQREFSLGHFEAAGELCKHQLALEPESRKALEILGDVYAWAYNAEEATRYYTAVLRLAPKESRIRAKLRMVNESAQFIQWDAVPDDSSGYQTASVGAARPMETAGAARTMEMGRAARPPEPGGYSRQPEANGGTRYEPGYAARPRETARAPQARQPATAQYPKPPEKPRSVFDSISKKLGSLFK
jgi:tetratricopeptide (TPR) repeat protein